MIAAFLTLEYRLPEGYCVSLVVRHGGRAGTGLSVFIAPPGDSQELRINYERGSERTSPMKLRSQAVADTNGLTRAHRITSHAQLPVPSLDPGAVRGRARPSPVGPPR
jgi:hypothetical protein